ncbi:hypothetical protein AMTRI_Chr03g49570 [Amborella trichopoda]
MYAMSCTRPDIALAIGKLSRYTSNPSQEYWNAVYRVLRYLKGTIDYDLYYMGEPIVLEGYNDVNWTTDLEESMITSKWIFTYHLGFQEANLYLQIHDGIGVNSLRSC